jgi:hypothetical protein
MTYRENYIIRPMDGGFYLEGSRGVIFEDRAEEGGGEMWRRGIS